MKPWLPLTSSGSKTARDLLPLCFWADEAVLALKIKDYIVSELQRSSSAEIKQAVCALAPGITARELHWAREASHIGNAGSHETELQVCKAVIAAGQASLPFYQADA